MPKVSVIIPVYNVEKYLRECLDSVVNQTLKDIEIICINDGSTDGSLAILEEYAAKDNRIIIINQENQGVSVARNAGIHCAKGRYITFLDSDDYFEDDCLFKMASVIENDNNDTDIYITKYNNVRASKKTSNKENKLIDKNSDTFISSADTLKNFINFICNKWYRRKFIINKNICFEPKIKTAEDGIFNLCVFLENPKIKFLNIVTYNYRRCNADSATSIPFSSIITDITAFEYFIQTEYFKNAQEDWQIIILNKFTKALSYHYNKLLKTPIKIIACTKIYKFYKFLKNNVTAALLDKSKYQELKKYNIFIKLIQVIFSVKNSNDKEHKIITILGFKIKIKRNVIAGNYKRKLKQLRKEAKNRKIKVCFLVSENSKWKTQSLYDILEKSENFEQQVIVTLLKVVHTGDDITRNDLVENYNFFKSKGMNVEYGYKDGEFVNLKEFKPDIIFYQQPWSLAYIQSPKVTSEFALNYYTPYYINNYDPMPFEYDKNFHKSLYKYYVLNKWWANRYKKLAKRNNIFGLGNPFLDYFYLKTNKNNKNRQYIIYAPHYSFFHELNKNPVNYGTFLENGELILEFAQKHPEQNWVFKPHPQLKYALYKVWGKDRTEQYYKAWEEIGLGCYDSSYIDLFLDSKLLITDSDSFLLEYFCTSNPIIHIVSEHCKSKVSDFSRQIFNTFYKCSNNTELSEQLNNIIIKNNDYKKELRIKALKSSKLINTYAAQNILNDIKKDARI